MRKRFVMAIPEWTFAIGHIFVQQASLCPTSELVPQNVKYTLCLLVEHPNTESWTVYEEPMPHRSSTAVTVALNTMLLKLIREENIYLSTVRAHRDDLVTNKRFIQYLKALDIAHHFLTQAE